MLTPTWQLQNPISEVLFDCDGTLSSIEGIDTLAAMNGVGKQVQSLTELAMGKTGINPVLYEERLDLVKPSLEQVIMVGKKYFENQAPHASEVIALLRKLNKSVYILSAGLQPAVDIF